MKYNFLFFRKLILNDILDEIEKPLIPDESEVSDENDESSEMVKQTEAHDLYIVPANDCAVTDEYSGEESVDISNLPGTQLTAFTVI